jgi:hypothetical protein
MSMGFSVQAVLVGRRQKVTDEPDEPWHLGTCDTEREKKRERGLRYFMMDDFRGPRSK